MDLTIVEFATRLTGLKELQELNGLNRLSEGKSYRDRLLEAFGTPRLAQDSNDGTEQNGGTADVADGRGSETNHIRAIRVIRGQSLRELDQASQQAVRYAVKAIASYVRSLLSGNSAFDRYEHGDGSALSDEARRGLQIFRGKGNCIACHSGPLLSDEDFHNTGVSSGKEPFDLGRFEVTQNEQDRGKFKVPSLRNVALTAPYMHDGSLATLDDVIKFYSKSGNPNPNLDRVIRPLNLNPQDQADLLAFLKTLSGEPQIQSASK